MSTPLLRALSILSCCLVLGACGQRGPLYLPHPATATPSAPPAGTSGSTSQKTPTSSAANPP
ncbi:lipoprotein [Comamonas sp.]|uniref:LPS translocon maturation chaperone LptM n=1 Tax=unclassified Comamonas TaxID=2638500 RepID=UPI001AC5BDDC|nr:lipoprotein [Comamonas sp.]